MPETRDTTQSDQESETYALKAAVLAGSWALLGSVLAFEYTVDNFSLGSILETTGLALATIGAFAGGAVIGSRIKK